MKNTILVADSCSGSINLIKYIQKWADNYQIIYLADYEKNPFGLKKQKEITNIVKSWLQHFLTKPNNIKLVIIACNTASIASTNEITKLSKQYKIPIISMIQGVESCFKINTDCILNKNVAIMATKYSIESKQYYKILKKYKPKKIINIIGTKCERAVAHGTYHTQEGQRDIEQELKTFKNKKINTVILACSCFQSISDQIKKILGKKIICLNPAKYVSASAKKTLKVQRKKKAQKIIMYSTAKSINSINGIKLSSSNNLDKQIKIKFIKIRR